MWTPAEEAELQSLQRSLGFLQAPVPEQPVSDGLLGFTGKTVANILPGALEKIIQPMAAIAGGGREDLNAMNHKVPNFYDVAPPKGVAQHVVAGAGELAEYLPSIMLSEGAAAGGLAQLGMAVPRTAEAIAAGARLAPTRAARIAASGLGFGVPMAPQGAETAISQGGVGALQTAAMDMGWRGKVAAGLIGGAAGYYEGAKGPDGTPMQGAIYGGLNLLGPTLIDPIVNKMTGYKPAKDIGGGRPIEGQPQPPAPSQMTGAQGVMDASFEQMNPAQRQAYMDATMGRSVPPEFIGPKQPQAGFFGDYFPNPATPREGFFGGREAGLSPDPSLGASTYGRGNEYDAFAGLQKPPILTQNELFPVGSERHFDPRMRMSEAAASGADIYGGSTGIFDAFQGVERAPTFGPESIFTPGEAAARSEFAAQRSAPVAPVESRPTTLPSVKKSKQPHERIPTGLQKLLGEDVGWTPPGSPLKEGFTRDAFNLGKKFKTAADVKRAEKMVEHYSKASKEALETAETPEQLMAAQELANRKQYFAEAVEYATGNPPKAATFRRHDPNYQPPVPHPEWTKMVQAGLDAPLPKTGDQIMHWGEDMSPLETNVISTENDMVKYHERNMITGESSEKIASLQEFDRLQKMPGERPAAQVVEAPIEEAPTPPPPKSQPGESPAAVEASPSPSPTATEPDARPRVMIAGKYGMEEAVVIGREGNTLHVQIDDPIFGPRQTSVLESDTRPVAGVQPQTPKGGVPFQDVESVKLRGGEGARGSAQRGESEADLLGSVMEGSGPGGTGARSLKGKAALSFEEGLKKLPAEAAAIIRSIYERVQAAVGHTIDSSLSLKMPGAKGGMYEQSGRVAYNLQWINGIVKNWDKMSPETRGRVLMRVTALFGHEISHVVQKFGERSALSIDGVPLIKAIMTRVDAMSQNQRHYIAEQLKSAKGDLGGVISKYLAGDVDTVYAWYKKHRPNLTMEQAKELAAGELMAEIGSVELIKRTNFDGLPDSFRAAVDKFKNVLVRVVDWFRGQKQHEGLAALQDLQNISAKMYDHFREADTHALGKAYPSSEAWKPAPVPNPFSSGTLPPDPTGLPPMVVANGALVKQDLLRLGIRATLGGVAGGIVGPQVSPNQIGTAEGVMLGAIAGLFGPAVVKKLLSGQLPQEVAAAIKVSKGNPLKTFGAILGGGKTLRELGQEARHGWTGQASAVSKFVRFMESEFNLNLDPKLKALLEEGRGPAAEQLALVSDALDKVRWYKPSPTMLEAVGNYFEGKISKDEFQKLLVSPELQTYGNFITTAREAMTNLTDMVAAGMPRSKFKDHLIETSDKYLGRFYSAYKEGKFNMAAFDKAKSDFMQRYPDYSDQMATEIMHEYMREVQANRNIFSPRRGNSGQKIDSSTTFRRFATEEEIEAQRVVVGGLEHDPYGAEYLKERGKLDWMQEHVVTDNWREWLGEYKSPVQRMIYTFQKVHPSAISGKVFDMLDSRINSNGLKFSYTPKELQASRELIRSEIAKGGPEVAALQNKLSELDGYGPVPEGAAYGKLQGKWVDRFTRDEINTYSTPFKWMDQPILRGIAQFNNMIKIGRTALNPITVVRNYLQMPVFALMSQAKAGDIGEAFNIIHRLKNDDYRLMLNRHIIGADYVTSELSRGPGTIFSGYMDSDIATKATHEVMNKVLKFYQQPDQLVRAGAFLSARRRFAQKLVEEGSMSLDEAMKLPEVIDKAVDFTERYTMNYATVPRIVKIGRQLPFVNLFISYTSEMTRILKNLTEDAISPGPNSAGRMHAITVLGAMAAIPAMIMAGAKGNLSPKDLADWEKIEKLSPDYNRARFRIPTGRDKEGRFHYIDITSMIPADNYTQMMKAFANGDLQAAAAANPVLSLQNTPLLNMAAEQIVGEDLRTGQKIAGFGRVREVLKEVLPPWIPPGYEGQRLVKGFSENAEGDRGLTNIKSGVQYKPSDIIASYLTGLRFGNVQLASVQKAAIREAQQEIAQQQQLLRETMNVNLPIEEKARAQAIYRKTVEEVMLRLHSRMGQPAKD